MLHVGSPSLFSFCILLHCPVLDWVFAHLVFLGQILGLSRKLLFEKEPLQTKKDTLYFGPGQRKRTPVKTPYIPHVLISSLYTLSDNLQCW